MMCSARRGPHIRNVRRSQRRPPPPPASTANTRLLQSGTDVFGASDWAAVWDHILTEGPTFQYQLLASYLVALRRPLLAARGERALHVVFGARRAVDAQQVCWQIGGKSRGMGWG